MGIVKNKSSVFVLPMILGVPYSYFRKFINCYVGCNHDDEDDERRIYLAFDSTEVDSIKDRVGVFKKHDQYVRTIIIDRFNVFVFRVPKVFHIDFDLFKVGKYSKFSKKYKKILKSIYKSKKILSAINPSDKDREELAIKLYADLPNDCEIFSIPEVENDETFTLAHFLEVDI